MIDPSTCKPNPAIRRSSGKRVFDLVGAVVALLLTLPLLVAALVAVWVLDRQSPIFVSERVGANGHRFRFFKIRTMVPNAHTTAVDTTIVGDPRITAVGKW